MQPHNLHLYFFSPTGGTKTVAGLFAEQLGAPDACTDITVHAEAKTFTADDRLLLFFPVYGGRVPEPCLARVRALRGTDTPVTLVAVFGIYFYMQKKGPRYNVILLSIIVISVVCALLGIL